MNNSVIFRNPIFGFILLFLLYHIPLYYNTLLTQVIFKILFLIVAILIATAQGSKGLNDFGLKFENRGLLHLLIGLILGITVFISTLIISDFYHVDRIVEVSPFLVVMKHLPTAIIFTLFASLVEDILIRGYFIKHASKLGIHQWAWLTALLFLLNHFWRFDQDSSVLYYIINLGLVLGYAVVISKNLWLAFGIHWGSNLIYETSTLAIKIEHIGNPNIGNWILGSLWLLVAIVMIVYTLKSKNKLNIS